MIQFPRPARGQRIVNPDGTMTVAEAIREEQILSTLEQALNDILAADAKAVLAQTEAVSAQVAAAGAGATAQAAGAVGGLVVGVAPAQALVVGDGGGTYTTNTVTASVSGGVAPYFYQWVLTGSAATLIGATTDTASVQATVADDESKLGNLLLTVTDSSVPALVGAAGAPWTVFAAGGLL
jgi:hypothetical protein